MNNTQILNLKIIKIIIIILFLFILMRLFHLQIIKARSFVEKSEKNISRRIYTKAPRGIIYDCNGKIFANNRPSFLLTITPTELKNKEKTFRIIQNIIHMTGREIEDKINYSPYPTFASIEIKHNLTPEMVAKVSEILYDLPGISIETEPVRNYPDKNLASHVLGYVGLITDEELKKEKDQNYQPWEVIGKEGIELYYNSYLRGKHGIKEIKVDANGDMVKVIGETMPISGNNIYLTIDMELQKICERELETMLKRFPGANGIPKAGTVIVMSPKTGEIFALCSKPDFNPNLFSVGISEKDYGQLMNHPWHPMFNRTISGLYPPASTFKMITAAAALEEHMTYGNTFFYCPGFLKVNDKIFNCDQVRGHGKIDFTDSISKSCDVVFYELGIKLGLEKIQNYSKEFNIGRLTGIDLPGESPGLLPGDEWKRKNIGEEWYIGDTVNMSIGQGYLLTTPLQMAVATSIVANGGTFYEPHLLKKVESENGELIYEYKYEHTRNVKILPSTFSVIKKGMELAVTEGTAKYANMPWLKIAGKTGTAESFVSPDNPLGENHTWFVSFAPIDEPEIVLVVFLEQAGGYAGDRCVPLGSSIIKSYFDLKMSKTNE